MNDLSLPFLLCRKIAWCCVVFGDWIVILCFVEIMFSISFVACYNLRSLVCLLSAYIHNSEL